MIDIKLPVLDGQKDRIFYKPDELKELWETETNILKVLKSKVEFSNTNFANHVFSILETILRQIQVFQKAYADNNTEELLNRLKIGQELFSICHYPFKDSIMGKVLAEKLEESPNTAFFILFFTSYPKRNSSIKAVSDIINPFKAAFTYTLNNHGQYIFNSPYLFNAFEANKIIAFTELERKVISDPPSFQEYEKKIDSINEMASRAVNRNSEFEDWVANKKDSFIKDNSDLIRKLSEDFEESKNNLCQEMETELASAKSTVQHAKRIYQSEIELNSSVTYWDSKGVFHSKEKKIWLGIAIIASLLAMFLPYLVHHYLEFKSIPTTSMILGYIHPVSLATTVLILSVLSFVIRFSTNQYSSHHHLQLESKERTTMIKTFLALMNENKLSESEDRRIALETLFRPGQTGIVKDNGPIIPSESVIKIIEKQTTK